MTDGIPESLSQLHSELIVAIAKGDADRAQRVRLRIDEIEGRDIPGVNGAGADARPQPIYVKAHRHERQISDPEFAALQLLWKKVLKEYALPNDNIGYVDNILAIALSDHSALEVRSLVVEVSDAESGITGDAYAEMCELRIPADTRMQGTVIGFHGEARNDDKAIMASLDYLRKLHDNHPIDVFGDDTFKSKVRNLAEIMGVVVRIAPERPAGAPAAYAPASPTAAGRPPVDPA
jgi:hypothetical protein